MAIVVIEKLCKTYQIGSSQVCALRDLDLSIVEGEYIAIMGPSGSGKSTLLNILGCIDKPTSGAYWLTGENISVLSDDKLSLMRGAQIGFIFQSYNLIPQLNVIENIEVPMHYHGAGSKDRLDRAKQLAEAVGLSDRLKHKPSELSGGQQQRVAIARALVSNPAIILADEPTGNLDSSSGSEILNILDELNQQGKTLIVVTHDEHIGRRAHRTVQVFDGQIRK